MNGSSPPLIQEQGDVTRKSQPAASLGKSGDLKNSTAVAGGYAKAKAAAKKAKADANHNSKPPTVSARVSTADESGKPTSDVAPAKMVHGIVVDDKGTPVAGADVWMMPAWDPANPRRPTHTTSNAAGRFVVPVPPFSERDLQRGWPYPLGALRAYASGYQLATANGGDQILGRDQSNVVIRLAAAAHTPFVVLGPDGKPLAGAFVEPNYAITVGGDLPTEILSRVAARTDADGRAVLTALPRDALNSIRVVTKDFGIQTEQLMGIGALPASQPIRLRRAGKVVGRVTAVKPEWTRGVRITMTTGALYSRSRDGDAMSTTLGFADVESDAQGRFDAPIIATGQLSLDAHVEDDLPVLPRIPDLMKDRVYVRSSETTEIEIPLEDAVAVHGSVRAKDTGKPIAKSAIDVDYGVGPQQAIVLTDSHGNYSARVLPGRVTLRVIHVQGQQYVHYGRYPRYDVPAGIKEFHLPPLVLVPAKSVAGRLVDKNGQPVANRAIWVAADGRDYGYGQSSANGAFTLTGLPAPTDIEKATYQTRPVAQLQHRSRSRPRPSKRPRWFSACRNSHRVQTE